MGRREILNGLFGIIAAAGAASIIGAPASTANYQAALFWGGIAAVAVGLIGIVTLLLLPRKPDQSAPPSTTIQNSGINTTNQSGGTNSQNFNL